MTFHFALSPLTSISSTAVPFSTAATCSSRSSARPTPFVELSSLPVPRGRGFGVPSSASVRCARISESGGKEGIFEGSSVVREELQRHALYKGKRGHKMWDARLDENGQYSLPYDTSMICPYSQLLTYEAPLPEVN